MPILASPFQVVAPLDVAASWPGISAMTWTGWDGSEWDLLGSNGVALTAGARGMSMPPVDRFTSTSPALAGSRWRGSRTLEREVFWPLFVYNDGGSQAWVEHDRAFWRTMDPTRPGLWSVTHPDGTIRTLVCRFVDDGDGVFDRDPSAAGWAVYGVTLVAEQPYWQGTPVTQTWKTVSPVSFFGAGSGGPPFTISPGSSLAKASINNPGDVDAYPLYTITGPVDSVSVGYAGNVVQLGAIADGQTRIVDTRPDRLTVKDQNGVDRWSELGASANFDAPLPPGNPISLSLAMVGAGTVTASIIPLYYRAW